MLLSYCSPSKQVRQLFIARDHPVRCWMFNSTPDLHILQAVAPLYPSCDNPKYLQTLPNIPEGQAATFLESSPSNTNIQPRVRTTALILGGSRVL